MTRLGVSDAECWSDVSTDFKKKLSIHDTNYASTSRVKRHTVVSLGGKHGIYFIMEPMV